MNPIDILRGGEGGTALPVNLLNLAILLFGVNHLAKYFWFGLKRELEELRRIKKDILDQATREGILALRAKLRVGGLLRQRLDRLSKTAERGGQVDQGALAAAAVADLDRSLMIPRYLSTVPVLIGLFGTLLGLNATVGGAQAVLQREGAGGQSLLGLFNGLGLAFSATLIGVVCTIILGFAVVLVRHKQSEVVLLLEDLTGGCILPYFQPEPSTALAQSATALTALQRDFSAGVRALMQQLEEVTEEVTDSLASRLGGLSTDLRERGVALTSTIDSSMSALQQEAQAILREFRSSHEAVQQLLGVNGNERHSLYDSVALLQGATQATETAAQSTKSLIPFLTEALEKQADRQSADLHTALSRYVERIDAALGEQRRLTQEAVEAVKGAAARSSEETIKHATLAMTAAVSQQAKMDDTVRDLSEVLRTLSAELARLRTLPDGAISGDRKSTDPKKPEDLDGDGASGATGAGTPSPIPPKPNLFKKWFGGGN